jgi:hypothetical protein
MKHKQSLFKKTPSRLGYYLPTILLIIAIFCLFGLVIGVCIYCQGTVGFAHQYNLI